MNLNRLYEILSDTTTLLRKGPVVHGDAHLAQAINEGKDLSDAPGGVVTIEAMPHVDELQPGTELVDLELTAVGVDAAAAERHRDELVSILREYPMPDRLAAGPSYIEVGAEIGDQGAAFQLFALGKVLGLWGLVTPATLGLTGDEARSMAGRGFVMITGFTA